MPGEEVFWGHAYVCLYWATWLAVGVIDNSVDVGYSAYKMAMVWADLR